MTNYAFSTLTLLDGYQEEHVACKQVLANTNRLYKVLCTSQSSMCCAQSWMLQSTCTPNLKSLCSPIMKIWEATQKVEIGVLWWVSGHPRSPAISPFNRAYMTSYSTLTETMYLSSTIFELQRIICQKSPILTYPPVFGAQVGGDPIWILQRSLVSENWSPWAMVWHSLHDVNFSRFDTILACDGWTDRRTDNNSWQLILR